MSKFCNMVKRLGQSPEQRHCLRNAALCFFCFFTLLIFACAKEPVAGYKLVFVADSGRSSTAQSRRANSSIRKQKNASDFVSQVKAAKLAVEKFNAQTNINNLPLELELLDLSQTPINNSALLQNYMNRLQRGDKSNGQRWLITGFVLGQENSPALQQFSNLLQQEDQVLIGHWQDGLPFQQKPVSNTRFINLTEHKLGGNPYLQHFVTTQRQLRSVFVVFDDEHQDIAADFIEQSKAKGDLELTILEYTADQANYAGGKNLNLASLLQANSRRREQRYGIVMFLSTQKVNESNAYLSQSPYRYLFNQIDFILAGKSFDLQAIRNPDTPHYFILQHLVDPQQQQDLRQLQNEYQKVYHLRANYTATKLYDSISLLAYSAKKTIESLENEMNLATVLYQNLLQTQFNGSTGHIFFDYNGQRLVDYELLQFQRPSQATFNLGDVLVLGVYSANTGQFIAN